MLTGVAHEPRLLPVIPMGNGGLQINVARSDGASLSPAQADGIDLLHSTNLALNQWSPLTASRTVINGLLHLELPHPPTPSFFLARQNHPAPLSVHSAATLREAVNTARPGSRILLAPGTYTGGFAFPQLRGQEGAPIIIAAADPLNPPVIQGGANGIQLSAPEWVELQDLVFTGATGNGLNIDDSGARETPARHLVLRRLRITDVGPTGNRDGIKLSGVTDFRIEGCTVERWGTGGSGIDLVGCHRGLIESNVFRHLPAASNGGANGVQAKGGSSAIVIRRNRFENTGARGVNLGGSTGLEFFRPPLVDGQVHWEAKELRVEGNTFLGSTAPIAFVGVSNAVVRFNTIYVPERWVIRILQENTAAGFGPCREGTFTDNLVVFQSTQWSAGGVNVGGNTAPTTFQFARNWWYCLDAPARSRPTLPTTETDGTYGISPQFRDATAGDLRLQPGSPAAAVGTEALP